MGFWGASLPVHCVLTTGIHSTAPFPYWMVMHSRSTCGEGGHLVTSSAASGCSGARYPVLCMVATGFCSTAPISHWIVKYSWSSRGESGYIHWDMSENTCGVAGWHSTCAGFGPDSADNCLEVELSVSTAEVFQTRSSKRC